MEIATNCCVRSSLLLLEGCQEIRTLTGESRNSYREHEHINTLTIFAVYFCFYQLIFWQTLIQNSTK